MPRKYGGKKRKLEKLQGIACLGITETMCTIPTTAWGVLLDLTHASSNKKTGNGANTNEE